jgi:hypothetical protein
VVVDGVRFLEKALVRQEDLLDMLTNVAARTWCSLEAKNSCYDRVAASPAPIEIRRKSSLLMIEEMRGSGEPPGVLLGGAG